MVQSNLDISRQLLRGVANFEADAAGSRQVCGIDECDELLRLAIQVGGIGIYETDFDRDLSRFSPELCAILGLPVGSEMTYREATHLYYGPDRAAAIARAEAAVHANERGRWSSVHRIERSDGAVRWISLEGKRTYRDTPQGPQPVRSIGTVIDVTHVAEVEEALRENERRLRLALDAARMGTFEVDLAGTQAVIDAQEARLLGLPENTRIVSVDELRKRVPVEDLQASDIKKKQLTENEEAYQHEFRLRLPSGGERWLSAHADVRSNRIFGINFDVTERKHAEAELRESEERLRIATSGAALGIFEWHPLTDHVVWENDRMYEIFGRTRADGPVNNEQFVNHYLHPDDVEMFEAQLQTALRTGGTLHAVCRIKWWDGSHRWLQIDAKSDTPTAQERQRLVGVIADITERKRLEQETKDLSKLLVNVQEEERERLAQELHDSTAQHLVAANLELTCLRRQAELAGCEGKHFDQMKTSLQEAMKEIRTFSYLMHPPALRSAGLNSTIKDYVAGFSNRTNIDVRARLNPTLDGLPFEMQRTFLRIAQEALANVHRHAGASHVNLDFRCVADRVHLIVKDDGRGNTPPNERAKFGSGCGVSGMTARAHQFGGVLRMRTGSRGTTLHVVVPAQTTSGSAYRHSQ